MLTVLFAVTAVVYGPGLNGPFLFDDTPNIIQPISAWLSGLTGWREVVLGNGSGIFHRPLSNLSFALNAKISGLDPLTFKLTNLAIHIMCGVALYALLVRLLRRDPQMATYAHLPALAITGLWLLHPIQVSTVLYVVQRMAQLSALFTLLALLAFVIGRLELEAQRTRRGLLWLFMAVPAATLAALLSKENGALAPLLCLAIEAGYFQASRDNPRPTSVKTFFSLALFAPAIFVIVWYATHPQQLLGGYAGRVFSLGERLLTQPRVLVDYMSTLLMPRGPSLGVYTDDFIVSSGLTTPATTLPAILALLALITATLWTRIRVPAIFTGIGIFLCGHVMESTALPLELYFEHRNYLPSAGIFFAAVGTIAWAFPKVTSQSQHPERLRIFATAFAFIFVATLASATYFRAGVWNSWQLLALQGVEQHPQSMRAHLDYAHLLQVAGQHQKVREVFEKMSAMDSPLARHVAAIDIVALDCMSERRTSAANVGQIGAIAGSKLQLAEMLAIENLANYLQSNVCENLSKVALAEIIIQLVDNAPQPERLTQLWRSRYIAGQLFAASGLLEPAQEQTTKAWNTGAADPAVGIYLTNIHLATGQNESAHRTLNDVRQRLAPWDSRNQRQVDQLDSLIRQ